ncbi:MAG TPA: hypothetical protein VM513_01005 [Kofleriaceae bacterium]|jgi:hypothetical protein|nr:hypothetical protein [Kofleriaceae bacterium]
MTKLSFLSLALAALLGCGTDSADIATTPLAGMVGGQAWTFQAGHTDAFLSDGKPDYFATLYAEQFTPCGFAPTGPHLIVAIPKATGDYEMGPMRNMTFVSDNDNKISFDGRIVVDTATPTTVSGGLVASFDGDNEVNGTFEVTVCPGQ